MVFVLTCSSADRPWKETRTGQRCSLCWFSVRDWDLAVTSSSPSSTTTTSGISGVSRPMRYVNYIGFAQRQSRLPKWLPSWRVEAYPVIKLGAKDGEKSSKAVRASGPRESEN